MENNEKRERKRDGGEGEGGCQIDSWGHAQYSYEAWQ